MIRRRVHLCALWAVAQALVAGPATTTRAPPRPSTVVAAEPEVAAPEAQSALDLTPAERARTCASLGVKHGAALSTQTDKLGGAALCTFAEYVLDGDGAPVLLLDARRAEHSKNLQADPRCSLLLQARDLDDRAAAVARVTIAGTATPVPKSAPDRVVLETQFGVRRGVELIRPTPSTRSYSMAWSLTLRPKMLDRQEMNLWMLLAASPTGLDLCLRAQKMHKQANPHFQNSKYGTGL